MADEPARRSPPLLVFADASRAVDRLAHTCSMVPVAITVSPDPKGRDANRDPLAPPRDRPARA